MATITVGRSPRNTIVVDSTYTTVSTNHATITEQGGALVLQDHSTNGTYINGKLVHNQSATICQGDKITLGSQYQLIWNEVMQYFDGIHATQRFQPMAPTENDVQRQNPRMAQYNADGPLHTDVISERETPKCLHKWNWGAFLLGWIWGVGNGVYWPLVSLIPYVGQIAALVIIFVLGANGNMYAWEKFNGTAAEFDARQKTWTKAGVIVMLVIFFLILLMLLAAIASY